MNAVLPGDIWLGKGAASDRRVEIVTARPGKRIRLRRLTGPMAGKEIMVSEDQLRMAFRYGMPAAGEVAFTDPEDYGEIPARQGSRR